MHSFNTIEEDEDNPFTERTDSAPVKFPRQESSEEEIILIKAKSTRRDLLHSYRKRKMTEINLDDEVIKMTDEGKLLLYYVSNLLSLHQ